MKGCVVVTRDEKIESSTYSWVQADIVKKVLQNMPQDETLYDLAELFKVFGDSGRIKILYALFEAELCVGDIAQLLGLTQTAVSHQLRILKANKLVKAKKRRKERLLFAFPITMSTVLSIRVWSM